MSEKKDKIDPSLLVSGIVAYCGINAAIWHVGFWFPFRVDIFQIIDFTDIIKNFIFPFIIAVGLYLVITFFVFALSQFIGFFKIIWEDDDDTWDKFRDLFVQKTSYKIFVLVYVILFVTFLAIPVEGKWGLLSPICSLPIVIFALVSNILKNRFPRRRHRSMVLYFILTTPIITFSLSREASDKISLNEEFSFVSSLELLDTSESPDKYLAKKLLAQTNDYIILTDLENKEVIMLRSEKVVKIGFMHWPTINSNP